MDAKCRGTLTGALVGGEQRSQTTRIDERDTREVHVQRASITLCLGEHRGHLGERAGVNRASDEHDDALRALIKGHLHLLWSGVRHRGPGDYPSRAGKVLREQVKNMTTHERYL